MEHLSIQTIAELMRTAAETYAHAEAILAPGRKPITYKRLYEHVLAMSRVLNESGIGRNDRVAVAVPSSAEGGVATISVEMIATSVPLNPAYSLAEFVEVMTRLNVKAIILVEGSETAAWRAAEQLDLRVFALVPLLDQEAGIFRLTCTKQEVTPVTPDSERGGFAHADDIHRLVLTSGTTAVSKVIPFTNKSTCSQLYDNARSAELTSDDRLLCFMPMFHSLGIAYLMMGLLTGGSTYVLPGFAVKTFF